MNIFLSGNKKIDDLRRATILFSSMRGANDISIPRKGNTIPKLIIKCTILRNYLVILDPLPANLGVHITFTLLPPGYNQQLKNPALP